MFQHGAPATGLPNKDRTAEPRTDMPVMEPATGMEKMAFTRNGLTSTAFNGLPGIPSKHSTWQWKITAFKDKSSVSLVDFHAMLLHQTTYHWYTEAK